MKISSKVPAEIVPITFDFSTLGLAAFDSVVSTGVAVVTGTDASVAAMVYGSPVVSGVTVVQLVKLGVAGNTYNVSCLVAKGNERYQLDADMKVKARHSA